jgi:hypothetical protein
MVCVHYVPKVSFPKMEFANLPLSLKSKSYYTTRITILFNKNIFASIKVRTMMKVLTVAKQAQIVVVKDLIIRASNVCNAGLVCPTAHFAKTLLFARHVIMDIT